MMNNFFSRNRKGLFCKMRMGLIISVLLVGSIFKPQEALSQVPEPTVTYGAGTHTHSVSKSARIEVYALGAGGGGQGGHADKKCDLLGHSYDCGTGGAGGSGAAAYMKFDIMEPITLEIKVGSGGYKGDAHYEDCCGSCSLRTGVNGGDGEATTVKWGSNTLTVAGGKGGGVGRESNDQTVTGGGGGASSIRPEAIALDNWDTAEGSKGDDGALKSMVSSMGANAPTLKIGSFSPFGGGIAAYNYNGSGSCSSANLPCTNAEAGAGGSGAYSDANLGGNPGGNGQVRIIVTYYHTVSFNTGTGGTSIPSQEVLNGLNATQPSNPTRDGYIFAGWNRDFSNIRENTEITAYWIPTSPPENPRLSCGCGNLTVFWDVIPGMHWAGAGRVRIETSGALEETFFAQYNEGTAGYTIEMPEGLLENTESKTFTATLSWENIPERTITVELRGLLKTNLLFQI